MIEKICVIILNYLSCDETNQLCESIRQHENKENYDIVIVDNSCNATEREKINRINNAHKIFLSENLGYANGNNIGIKYAIQNHYKYILIANSDTLVIEDRTFPRLCAAMKNSNASIIGPEILDRNNKPTAGAVYLGKFGDTIEKRTKEPTYCEGLIGAFFMLDSSVVEKNGYIDERFFLYLEETDYFYKAFKQDIKILYNPRVKIVHFGGTTTSKVYDYYISRNRFLLVRKNFTIPNFILSTVIFFKYCLIDFKQYLACKIGIRHYDYSFRRKMRWRGYKDGVKGIVGKVSL